MGISLDKAFGIHEAALRLRAERTQVLANNIANADTPGYKARDIDFKSALSNAMQKDGATSLKTTDPAHISSGSGSGSSSGSGVAGGQVELMYREPNQPALDGNTVESHVEQAEFARNALEYQASLKFLEGRSKGLIKALKGE
ncbi:MAG TPA: flagellar basal body rod protein FlgB [Candidatus Tenderia sp.]|nr:flagellar basal body rod protein FlgB [Candidatus Tenderia sp.]